MPDATFLSWYHLSVQRAGDCTWADADDVHLQDAGDHGLLCRIRDELITFAGEAV